MPLNSEINPEKYEHSSQVRDLKPSGQIPPQESQQAEPRSVCKRSDALP
jgi:hypothetical protein